MTQSIRKEFFAYRNGIVADGLRRAGDPHEVIMGCQLADVITIAARYDKNAQLAQELWNDSKHRECRMVAPMLYPHEEMDMSTAIEWASSVESVEIADVLCHRLLRHLPEASQLWKQLRDSDKPLVQYTAWRLLLNLLLLNKVEKNAQLRTLVEQQLITATTPLLQVLQSIKEEL